MCDQAAVSWQMPQKPTVVLFGSAKVPQRDQQTLYMQVCSFLEEHESSAPSHLIMPRLNLRDPKADSIFTAGFHRVL